MSWRDNIAPTRRRSIEELVSMVKGEEPVPERTMDVLDMMYVAAAKEVVAANGGGAMALPTLKVLTAAWRKCTRTRDADIRLISSTGALYKATEAARAEIRKANKRGETDGSEWRRMALRLVAAIDKDPDISEYINTEEQT